MCQDVLHLRSMESFMPRLDLQQVLTLTGTSFQKFQTLRRRNQIAMAFGRGHAPAFFWYIPVDCVGMLLVAALGEAYGNKLAFPAQLVRVYGDVWLECVAYAEAGLERPCDVNFCVVDLERESDGKAGHLVVGSMGMKPEHAAFQVHQSQPPGWVQLRINCVNISVLIRRVRRAAAEYNNGKPVEELINLDAPFMPPPSSDEFKRLMDTDYFRLRDQLFTDARTIKSREAAAARHGEKPRLMVMR
jgi:hypothetical protein